MERGVWLLLLLVATASAEFLRQEQGVTVEKVMVESQLSSAEFDHCLSKDLTRDEIAALPIEEKNKLFREGPCHPIVLVPGFLGSKLQVVIDCQRLRKEDPETYFACWSEGQCTLMKEYEFWVPDFFDILTLTSKKSEHCWATIAQMIYDPTEADITKRFKNPPGVHVTWFGDTPNTAPHSDNGLAGVADVTPPRVPEKFEFLRAFFYSFYDFRVKLIENGYVSGSSVAGIPYDWRLPIISTGVKERLPAMIEQLYQATGKKVVIVGHSYGNLNTLYALNHMSQTDKDKMIHRWINIAGPMAGASESLAATMSGDNEIYAHGFGIPYHVQKSLIGQWGVTYELITKPSLEPHAKEAWWLDLVNRIDTEYEGTNLDSLAEAMFWNRKYTSGNLTLPWMPTPLICRKQLMDGKVGSRTTENCYTSVENWLTTPVLVVKDRQYYATAADISDMMTNGFISFPDISSAILKDITTSQVHLFINPGVETDVVYGSSIKTTGTVYYDQDPGQVFHPKLGRGPKWPGTKHDIVLPSSKTAETGDGSVPSSSALYAGIKWAHNYVHQTVPNAKKTRIFEYCSRWAESDESTWVQRIKKYGIFDTLDCTCMQKGHHSSGSLCKHRGLVNDPILVSWVMSQARSSMASTQVAVSESTPSF